MTEGQIIAIIGGCSLIAFAIWGIVYLAVITWNASRDTIPRKTTTVTDYLGNRYVYDKDLYDKRERAENARPNSFREPIDGVE